MSPAHSTAWKIAADLPDPELPVVTIADLGILRDVTEDDQGRVHVQITPTYSGCPAMETISEDLVAALRRTTDTLVGTLADADQSAPCWTWSPGRQDVGFVTRHQVQEAAVHHWDALAAVGRVDDWTMTADLARDAVEEFLTCSVANARWPMEDGDPGLGGTLRLDVADGPSYDVVDGELPGTLSWTAVDEEPARGVAPEQALLWLYRRAEGSGLPDAADPVVARFREMSNTD